VVTSRDVARVAGVSQTTVSRVLSNSPKVSSDTRSRIEAVFRQLGYEPHGPARAMRTNRSETIGVVVSWIDNPFYPELLQALSDELGQRGKRMIVWYSPGPAEKSAAEAVRQRYVDGVIFTTATSDSVPLHEALSRSSPVVLVNRTLKSAACDQIESNNVEGARKVIHYLASGGHRKIAMIGGIQGTSTADKRLAGFRKGLAEVGIKWSDDRHIRGDYTHERAGQILIELMSRKEPPTAIFCANDLTAFGALDGARRLGVRVPDDLWVVGYDDIAMSSWSAYDLTTIRQPILEMASLAVRCLMDRIEGRAKSPRLRHVSAELVVRGSTANHRREELPKSQETGAKEVRRSAQKALA
jgi:LacI family transcriptional regulator